ncbi:MAG: hypothetical protein LBD21_11665 [Tannerellaceae bacterium]|jgi:hypothetical protein|nr:hypothetical protein [Tannerellaceae bacterium]
MKNLFFALAALVGIVTSFSSCSKDNEVNSGTQLLHFDKNNVVFEAAASSATIRILEAKEWGTTDFWGVGNVKISTAGDTIYFYNTFEIYHSETANASFNVHVNPFVGESFRFERKGDELHLQLSENTGRERELTLEINAGMYGYGEIRLIQKGK